jgi:hypothetical protein
MGKRKCLLGCNCEIHGGACGVHTWRLNYSDLDKNEGSAFIEFIRTHLLLEASRTNEEILLNPKIQHVF